MESAVIADDNVATVLQLLLLLSLLLVKTVIMIMAW